MTFTRRVFFKLGAMFGLVTLRPAPALPPADCCVLCGYDRHLKTWRTGQGFRWDSKREAFLPVTNKLQPQPGDLLRCADATGCQARQMNALMGTETEGMRAARERRGA